MARPATTADSLRGITLLTEHASCKRQQPFTQMNFP
jgi:hypothetical protein